MFFSETGLDSIGGIVITDLGGKYMNFSQEAIFLNTMGAILIALAILIPCILGCEGFRYKYFCIRFFYSKLFFYSGKDYPGRERRLDPIIFHCINLDVVR